MKISITTTSQANEDFTVRVVSADEQIAWLRLLNTQIKKSETRSDALSVLLGITPEMFSSPGVAMYYFYLLSKAYRLIHEDTTNINSLLMSAEMITRVFTIARESVIKVKNPKYHFARAYTYFCIASCRESVDESFYQKTLSALRAALTSFSSPSLIWLHGEVMSFALRNKLSPPTPISHLTRQS